MLTIGFDFKATIHCYLTLVYRNMNSIQTI